MYGLMNCIVSCRLQPDKTISLQGQLTDHLICKPVCKKENVQETPR